MRLKVAITTTALQLFRFCPYCMLNMRPTFFALRKALAVALITAATVRCHGPIPAMALSPVGHGGPPSARGPHPVGPLWRANVMSAPVVQEPCDASYRAAGGGVSCSVPSAFRDSYAASLEALQQGSQDTTGHEIIMLQPMAEVDEGV